MKIKRNRFLALAVLVPFLLLAGCGDDDPTSTTSSGSSSGGSSGSGDSGSGDSGSGDSGGNTAVLTDAQKTALTDLSGKAVIGVESNEPSVVYTYKDISGKDVTNVEANAQNKQLDIITGYGGPTYLDLDDSTDTDDKLVINGASIIYKGHNGTDGKTIYYYNDNEYKANSMSVVTNNVVVASVESYVLELPITITLDKRVGVATVTLSATVKYDTESSVGRIDNCDDFNPDTGQSEELKMSGDPTGVYVALGSDETLLICKES